MAWASASHRYQSPRRRLALAVGLGCLLLAGCQGGEEEGGTIAPLDIFSTTTDQSADSGAHVGPSGTLEMLGQYFVQSFDAFEAAAQELRETDARYTLQRNSWSVPGSSRVYESYPLAAARVEYAHAAGLTGAGATVSIVDDGFRLTHEALAGGRILVPAEGVGPGSHGTSVASVLAGDSGRMIGTAPGATLALGHFDEAGRTAATREALRLGAVAQNNSWGFPGLGLDATSFGHAFGGSGGAEYLAALDAYAAEGVVVFAVSNDRHSDSATLMEALPHLRPSLEAGWLAVVNGVASFDADRVTGVARISAGCLEAARWCLVADGTWEAATGEGDASYSLVSGSSFAAPQVAGALALLAEAFPTLTPHDLRIRLLASADNGFFTADGWQELAPGFQHAYSTEFGHGFLDLRAALLPIGTPSMQLADGGTVTTAQPLIAGGSAMGDAVVQALSAHRVLVSDRLGGDFYMAGRRLASARAPRPPAAERLRDMMGADLAQRRRGEVQAETLLDQYPGTTYRRRSPLTDLRYTVVAPGEGGESEAYGLTVARDFSAGALDLDLGLTMIREDGEVVGFDTPSGGETRAFALEFGATAPLGGGAFAAVQGAIGGAATEGAEMFDSVTPVRFDSLSVDLGRRDSLRRGDSLRLGLSLPAAVSRGTATMALPVARGAGGTVFEEVEIDLSPAARQIDLRLAYQVGIGGGWEALFEASRSFNDGHVAGETGMAALIGLTRRF